ncbi:putative transcriptional regulator [Geobacillus phage vB_GthS_PK3.5]|nr:putative transcriptional regulator [Geobacillus phage vB_GthS_PK3.5]UYL94044.1 putative transcriptional regulator [Geobacillus phage vB_GthS_PK3.6]
MSQFYFEDATKEQLITICLYEDCPLEYKYEAARELEIRKWREEMLTELVRLWGKGYSTFEIAIELGIDENTVKWQLQKHGLYRKRVRA